MSEQPIFLSYWFNGGWRFEFHGDYIIVTNPANGDKYRIAMDPYQSVPFQIMLIEHGKGQP